MLSSWNIDIPYQGSYTAARHALDPVLSNDNSLDDELIFPKVPCCPA
jgi:hypothetical protein